MARRIPESFINELMQRVDIVDVIDRRVPLTRKGKEYVACCPFHEEKTPSFTVSPSKQFYHCFGCQANGTAIGFLMEYENLSFVEAVETLADQAGLSIPAENQPYTAVQTATEDPKHLQNTLQQANQWFQQQLRQHSEAKQAINYLKERGLDGKTAADFGIGYAPDSWDGLIRHIGSDKNTLQQLEKTGMVIHKQGDKDSSFYDRFRARIMFPIEDYRGRIVGFGGRSIGDQEPKYLNSPETSLFHKGAELYNLHRARRAVDQAGYALIVEGYMDVIALSQNGIGNAVATLGTATTRTHLQRLFRLTNTVIFCFDGDRAGKDAAWKALKTALAEMQDGREIRLLFLPEKDDPDSFIRREGQTVFQQKTREAPPLSDYFFNHLREQVDLSHMEGKSRLISLARPLLQTMPDGALKDLMHDRLTQLTGHVTAAPETASTASFRQPPPPSQTPLSPLAKAINLLLNYPRAAKIIESNQALNAGLAELHIKGGELLIGIVNFIEDHPNAITAQILEHFREHPHHSSIEKLATRPTYVAEENIEATLVDLLNHLIADEFEHQRQHLLNKAQTTGLSETEKTQLKSLLLMKKRQN